MASYREATFSERRAKVDVVFFKKCRFTNFEGLVLFTLKHCNLTPAHAKDPNSLVLHTYFHKSGLWPSGIEAPYGISWVHHYYLLQNLRFYII